MEGKTVSSYGQTRRPALMLEDQVALGGGGRQGALLSALEACGGVEMTSQTSASSESSLSHSISQTSVHKIPLRPLPALKVCLF